MGVSMDYPIWDLAGGCHSGPGDPVFRSGGGAIDGWSHPGPDDGNDRDHGRYPGSAPSPLPGFCGCSGSVQYSRPVGEYLALRRSPDSGTGNGLFHGPHGSQRKGRGVGRSVESQEETNRSGT